MNWTVRVAGTGNLLVEDSRRNRIAVVTPDGIILYAADNADRQRIKSFVRPWLNR